MSDLRVFFNGGAYVIADSPENASKLLSIHFGPDPRESTVWIELPADRLLTVRCQLVLNSYAFSDISVQKTAAQWVASYGGGFLFSADI